MHIEAVKKSISLKNSDGELIDISENLTVTADKAVIQGLTLEDKKEYWNQGLGTAMMEKIIERGKNMNIKSIELEVIDDNLAGIALYHKMGFEDIGIYKKFWHVNGIYKDAIIMQKIL